MTSYLIILIVIYIISTILSLWITFHNYRKCCILEEGNFVHVYSVGGFIWRIIASILPGIHFYSIPILFTEPFDTLWIPWLRIDNHEEIWRYKLYNILNKHKLIN